ncbi:MAG: hypothetical protein AMXMBFR13_25830 [Phycisphaerae bacterium]
MSLARLSAFILLVLLLWCWNRSHWVHDELIWSRAGDGVSLLSQNGQIWLVARLYPPEDKGAAGWSWRQSLWGPNSVRFRPQAQRWQVLGFSVAHGTSADRRNFSVPARWAVAAPYWFFVAAAAPLPVLWLLALRRQWRHIQQMLLQCSRCGYDLRGNVSGVCPECGMPARERRPDGSKMISTGPSAK